MCLIQENEVILNDCQLPKCLCKSDLYTLVHLAKAVADDPVGQVLAGPLFLKVKTKFNFTKRK